MRVAALDLGTNTFLLFIAEVNNGRIETVVRDEVRVIRLGQNVHESRRFHPEALGRAEACFSEFRGFIKAAKVDRTLAVATSAARDVTNGDELVKLAARFDIPVEIVSGEREAELTFWGTIKDEAQPILIIDVGGGSTEFILGDRTGLIARQSLDIGSVRLTEMFVSGHPIQAQEMAAMANLIQDRLQSIRGYFPSDEISVLTAVAGTPTTLAAMDLMAPYEAEKIEGHILTLAKLRNWVQKLANMTIADRQALIGMEPKRADVIVGGSLILMLSCQCFNARSVQVSIRGLRYGVARWLSRWEKT